MFVPAVRFSKFPLRGISSDPRYLQVDARMCYCKFSNSSKRYARFQTNLIIEGEQA